MTETARPVAVKRLPVTIDDLVAWGRGLTAVFGPGLTIDERHGAIVAWTPGEICWCWTCDSRNREALAEMLDAWSIRFAGGMILCPLCGNKRCPHATHHDNTCTGDNESGQEGSRYA